MRRAAALVPRAAFPAPVPRAASPALVVLAAVMACGATACAAPHGLAGEPPNGSSDGPSQALAQGTRRVVMVSGRDDHGLVASPNIVLRSAPGTETSWDACRTAPSRRFARCTATRSG